LADADDAVMVVVVVEGRRQKKLTLPFEIL
jgi:hypothetical protein